MDNAALIARYERRAASFYDKVDRGTAGRGRDELYARPDDVPLTDEEKAAIDAYWGKYRFAYPHIDYKSFQTFKNRFGRFDVRHCPGNVAQWYFRRRSIDGNYAAAYGNKTLAAYMFPDLPQPRTFFRRMDRYYYDENFLPVDSGALTETCAGYLKNGGELIIKPGVSRKGSAVYRLTGADADCGTIRRIITQKFPGRQSFVIQEAVRQSGFTASLNASSVNTLRITTLLHNGRPVPLAALIRIGAEGKVTNSFRNPGSALLGVDIDTGLCNDWALTRDMERVSVLPGGADLSRRMTVPQFGKIKTMVLHAHCRIPYLLLMSWDIALDENNEPVFIKCVPDGRIQMHEAVTEPLFGPYMDELLDSYLLEKFYIFFATEDCIYREYHDRVVVEEYLGRCTRRGLPATLRGKPVFRKEDTESLSCCEKGRGTDRIMAVVRGNRMARLCKKLLRPLVRRSGRRR